jgi:hypothetical protein
LAASKRDSRERAGSPEPEHDRSNRRHTATGTILKAPPGKAKKLLPKRDLIISAGFGCEKGEPRLVRETAVLHFRETAAGRRPPLGARILLFLMIVCLSCTGVPSRSEDGQVEVVFWHAMGGPLGDMLEDTLIAEFNIQHPHIRVVPVNMGNYRALSQKIMASVMAGSPPGVAQAYETWTAQLIRGGVIVPLDSLGMPIPCIPMMTGTISTRCSGKTTPSMEGCTASPSTRAYP